MGDVLSGGGEGPRLRDRWTALPRTVRRITLAVAATVLLAVVTGYALTRPEHAGPAPVPTPTHTVPYPVHSTRIGFVRIHEVDPDIRTFEVQLRARTADPVLVERVSQDYANVEMGLYPSHPVRVEPGRPKLLRLYARVASCRGLPVRARLPFLEVTLRNARATQELSFIPGDRYAQALTRVFRTVCEPSASASATTP